MLNDQWEWALTFGCRQIGGDHHPVTGLVADVFHIRQLIRTYQWIAASQFGHLAVLDQPIRTRITRTAIVNNHRITITRPARDAQLVRIRNLLLKRFMKRLFFLIKPMAFALGTWVCGRDQLIIARDRVRLNTHYIGIFSLEHLLAKLASVEIELPQCRFVFAVAVIDNITGIRIICRNPG